MLEITQYIMTTMRTIISYVKIYPPKMNNMNTDLTLNHYTIQKYMKISGITYPVCEIIDFMRTIISYVIISV